jgi:hypothetical protein
MPQVFWARPGLCRHRKEPITTFRVAGTLLLILACGSAAAHATPLFGIVSSGSAGDVIDGQRWNTDGYLSLVAYTSPVLSYSDSYQVNSLTISNGATAWFSADGDGGLHGYAFASTSVSATNGGAGGAGASFSGIWTDTLYVIGRRARPSK